MQETTDRQNERPAKAPVQWHQCSQILKDRIRSNSCFSSSDGAKHLCLCPQVSGHPATTNHMRWSPGTRVGKGLAGRWCHIRTWYGGFWSMAACQSPSSSPFQSLGLLALASRKCFSQSFRCVQGGKLDSQLGERKSAKRQRQACDPGCAFLLLNLMVEGAECWGS